jgi:hypothetical protein
VPRSRRSGRPAAHRDRLTERDVLATTVSVLAGIGPTEIRALESAIPVSAVMAVEVPAVEEGTDLREAAR